ncbi:hypothetical protein B0H21DRAFT_740933 [Amylocystis lapponica]|nr:hypothetical protein B0H21DRAFT_740933 [Amylocystis lapponica]
MRLQSLSVEVMTLILDILLVKDMLACKLVCRFLSRVIDASDYLQYKIELAAADMADGPAGGLTAPERRNMLMRYQKAWREVTFSSRPTLTIPSDKDDPTGIISGDVFLQVKPKSLRLIQLPSRTKRKEERRWSIDTAALGFSVEKIAMDPSQDLLVVVNEAGESEAPIHLLTLASGAPHPSAALAVLRSAEPADNASIREIRIHGDAVGWMVFAGEDEGDFSSVQLWNWKTGDLVWNTRVEYPEPLPLAFTFLDDTHLVLSYDCRLVVHAFDAHAASVSASASVPLVSLDLPPLLDEDDNVEVLSVAFEPPAGNPTHPARTPGTPFARPAASALLLVCITLQSTADRAARFLLFVPTHALRTRLLDAPADPKAHSVPWARWGPQSTRLLEVPYGHSSEEWSAHGAHGARGVVAAWADFGARELCVRVLEFAPLLLRSEMLEGPAPKEEKEGRGRVAYATDAEPWTVRAEDCFAEAVQTRVVCRQSRWFVSVPEGDVRDVRLYEDGLVLTVRGRSFVRSGGGV